MATIVDIRSAVSAKSNRPLGAPAKGSADILIFTGVRYSRWGDDRSHGSQPQDRRARDRLDLGE